MPTTPSRRALLRAAAGSPLVAGLLGRAHAQPAKPHRFILIRDDLGFGHLGQMNGGPAPHRLVPPKARDASGVPLPAASLPAAPHSPGAREVAFTSAADLPPSLSPLRRWWQSTMVLDRFFNPFAVDLHGSSSAMYTMMPPALPGTPPRVTLENAIAQRIGSDLPFPVARLSHKGDTPLNYYERFLGALGAGGAGQLAQRRSVMTAVRAQVGRLKGVAGREDLQRLDSYLGSLREAERSLEQLAAWKCEPLAPPSVGPNLVKYEPTRPLVSHANLDTAAAALVCGLTRVASLNFIPGRGPFQFFDPNPNEFNQQGALSQVPISSDTRYADLVTGLRIESAANGDPGGNSWTLDRHDNHHAQNVGTLTAIDRWEAALVARLIERLQATPEGAGTMWDHTLILWANGGGGIHHYGVNDHVGILIGGPAIMQADKPGLLRGGRYLSFPKKSRAMSDLYVTVAQALGIDMPSFGEPSICKGPLPGARA